ncbi:outer membrane beta-barrel protein [Sphingomonas donggukensis]|uniref:Outer membrane beta-barrel protein n=1 Tax=Sphingomonas donggukensis TaxID=2949093 RepID=A0ABY4TXN2_9SPHN|nr:outer membrane beta-barrel protein [Sphingomonas donggukensis]URW77107.1 outer membrane beta-barrel protein [Sphingomonas donggukensis]
MKRLAYATLIGTAAMTLAAPAMAQDTTENRFGGFYVGASGGYDVQPNDDGSTILFDRNLDGTFGDTVTTAAGANAFSPGFCNGRATSSAPTACRNDKDGWSYNGKIGFDIQSGKIVFGAVGEFGKSEINDSVSAFSTTPASYTMRRSIEWEGAARLRAGYVAGDSTLFYGTGGLGYARIDNEFFTSNTANAFAGRGKRNQLGFQAGGGIEQLLGNNFSVGVEYMYHEYKDDDYRVRASAGTAPATNPFILAPNTTGTDFRRSDDKFRWHSLRATAAFRF